MPHLPNPAIARRSLRRSSGKSRRLSSSFWLLLHIFMAERGPAHALRSFYAGLTNLLSPFCYPRPYVGARGLPIIPSSLAAFRHGNYSRCSSPPECPSPGRSAVDRGVSEPSCKSSPFCLPLCILPCSAAREARMHSGFRYPKVAMEV
jgi:hypothetical protein